jgi:putative transcriptional regulator
MIRSHPSETSLLACAAGTLPAPHAAVIAVHLAQCPQCREVMRLGEEIGGHLIESGPSAALSPRALDDVMARLDQGPPSLRPAPTLAGLAVGRWRRLGPGIALMRLAPRDATGTRLDLIRVAPGVTLPRHGHGGFESTCVLRGAYADKTGEYHEGDVAEGDEPLVHAPRALGGGECICIVATTGRLRPRTVLARLIRPLLGL